MKSILHPTVEVLSHAERHNFARLIVARFQGRPDMPTVYEVMGQQYYARDMKVCEWGVATCLDAVPVSNSVWVFQSLEQSAPRVRAIAWLHLAGNCRKHQDAVDHAEAEAWAKAQEAHAHAWEDILVALPAEAVDLHHNLFN